MGPFLPRVPSSFVFCRLSSFCRLLAFFLMTIVEHQTETMKGFEEVQDEEQQEQQPRQLNTARRRWLLIFSVIMASILTMAVVIPLVVVLKKKSNRSKAASSSSSSSFKNDVIPTFSPTLFPSLSPTNPPRTKPPSISPTTSPTISPTTLPTTLPSKSPSQLLRTKSPSFIPTVVNVTFSPPSSDPTIRATTTTPTFVPSSTPSSEPSTPPTLLPSLLPSAHPSFVQFTLSPSVAPSPGGLVPAHGQPTQSPTGTFAPSILPKPINQTLVDALMQLLQDHGVDSLALQEPTTREYQAFQFLVTSSQVLVDVSNKDDEWWLQRYALTSLYATLGNTTTINTARSDTTNTSTTTTTLPSVARADIDHCHWRDVTCGSVDNPTTAVTDIVWSRRNFMGTLPYLEWTMLSTSLMHLDLSENELLGTLPTSLYQLSLLTSLYLHTNHISGPLHSDYILQDVTWVNLTRLYLNDNQLSGSIPRGFQYNSVVRPLRFVLLQNNRLTGTLPSSLNWNKLFYLDLGNNLLDGTLPEDFGYSFYNLKNLLLDSNQFTGTIPVSWSKLGNGRLEWFAISNNHLTGGVPTGWGVGDKLLDLEVKNNSLTRLLDQTICDMNLINNKNGNLIELDADCNICTCNYLCNTCNSSR